MFFTYCRHSNVWWWLIGSVDRDFPLEGIIWNWCPSCLHCTIWVILLFDCVSLDPGISSLHSLSCDAKIFTPYAHFHRSIHMSVLQMFLFQSSNVLSSIFLEESVHESMYILSGPIFSQLDHPEFCNFGKFPLTTVFSGHPRIGL